MNINIMTEFDYTKQDLIKYLLSEIDDLEPKDAYYNDYYRDLANTTVIFKKYNYKKLFIEELKIISEKKIINFMKRNKFLSIDDSTEDIKVLLKTYFLENNNNSLKSNNDNSLECDYNNLESNNDNSLECDYNNLESNNDNSLQCDDFLESNEKKNDYNCIIN